MMKSLYVATFVVLLSQNAWISVAESTMPPYCLEATDPGTCEALMWRWHYNPQSGQCENFVYGGCEGNKNNFEDIESCTQACKSACGNQMCMIECPNGFKLDERGCTACECNPEVDSEPIKPPYCLLSADPGTCEVAMPRWYYNPENNQCEEFTYGGCEGNENNFGSIVACTQACKSECGIQMCMMECPSGFKQDQRGCNLCECRPEMVLAAQPDKCQDVTCESPLECRVFELTMSGHKVPRCVDPAKPEECQVPMDAGPCKATKSRWFYNSENHACEEFMYGGCKGNTNNYQDESSCQRMCIEGDAQSECSEMMCMMYCDGGFKKDSRGCDLCECEEVCPQDVVCGLSCRHGYKKDDQDCTLCECRDKPPCLKDIVCTLDCMYGLVVLDDGCELCQCQKEPCAEVDCGAEEICQNEQIDGIWTGTCISFHVSKPWCGLEMCAMHCEHGMAVDQKGCRRCECLEESPAMCTLEECEPGSCPYGMSYHSNGCRTCECLPSPCQLDTCPLTEACEIKVRDDCTSCPAGFSCLAPDQVQRVSVSLHYFCEDPPQLNDEELLELKNELHQQLIGMMGIDKDALQGLKVQPPSEATISISFHLVSFIGRNETNNLVTLYESFKEQVTQHTDHSTLTYDGHTLIPEHSTLAAQYHSEGEVPADDLWEDTDDQDEAEENMTQTITIIAAVAAGCIALAVIVIILAAIVRSKTKHKGQYQKHKNSKNVVYKKAPNSDMA